MCPCFPEAHLSKTLWDIVPAKNFLSDATTESTSYKSKNGPMRWLHSKNSCIANEITKSQKGSLQNRGYLQTIHPAPERIYKKLKICNDSSPVKTGRQPQETVPKRQENGQYESENALHITNHQGIQSKTRMRYYTPISMCAHTLVQVHVHGCTGVHMCVHRARVQP